MARVTNDMLLDLAAALRGETPTGGVSDKQERFRAGAVWYGDWFNRDAAEHFGSPEKPRHNACIAKSSANHSLFSLAPITSQPKTQNCVVLPRGIIPGGKFTASYILPRIRLLASCQTLEKHFKYRCNLPEQYVSDMLAVISRRGE